MQDASSKGSQGQKEPIAVKVPDGRVRLIG